MKSTPNPTTFCAESSEQFDPATAEEIFRLLNRTSQDYTYEVKAWVEKHWTKDLNYHNEDLLEWREKCHSIVRKVLNAGLISLEDLRTRPSHFFKLVEYCGWGDPCIGATLFAGYLIFGGSLVWLGTDRHKKWYAPVDNYEMPGCFSMTEIEHGSNLRGLGTTATYDPQTEEFVIHTPQWRDAKWAVALLAYNAQLTTVMARLILPNGEDKGIHSFLVPVRDSANKPLPGVVFADCDRLVCYSGVGIGGCIFDHVRIPRENLLNRFADVTPEGEHISKCKSSGELFRSQVNPLMIERVLPMPSMSCKIALTIATRLSFKRRQFGPRDQRERVLIEYTSHQKRLVPGLADTYALALLTDRMHQEVDDALPGPLPEAFPPMAAAFKAYAFYRATRVVTTARECCSVHGFRHETKIARAMLAVHGFAHAAGDPIVLLQYAARSLMMNSAAGVHPPNPFANTPDDYESTEGLPATLGHHNALLNCRYERLLTFARMEFTKAMGSGKSRDDAWNEVLTYAIDLSLAYAQCITHRHFLHRVRTCEDARIKPLFEQLAELFGWNCISEHLGWFKDGDEPNVRESALEVDQIVMGLCSALTPELPLLTQSFGIPEVLLPPADLIADLEHRFR